MRTRAWLSAMLVLLLVFPSVALGVTPAPEPAGIAAKGRAERIKPLAFLAAEADDDIPGVPLPASPVVGTLEYAAGDWDDVYGVYLDAGDSLVVDMTGPAEADFDLYLYKYNAPDLASDTYIEAAATEVGSTEHLAYTAMWDGTYFLDVNAFTGSGQYTLTWSKVLAGPDDDLPGVPLPDSPVGGTVDRGVDMIDVYAVELAPQEQLIVEMSGPMDADFDLELYSPGAASAASIWEAQDYLVEWSYGDYSEEGFTYETLSAGTYYLVVSAYDGAGAYTLTWAIDTVEPDDDIPGVPLPPSPVNDSLTLITDTDDIYSVVLQAGDVIDLTMTGDPAVDLDLALLTPGITTIWSGDYPDFVLATSYNQYSDEHITATIETSGTYYVHVSAYGTGSYTLTWSINGGTPTNTAPVAVNDAYTVNEDMTLAVPAPGFLGNDTDAEGDTLAVSWRTEPAHGFITVDAAGAIGYVPDLNFSGTDSFSYKVTDGQLESNVAVVTITVNPVNDAPVLDPIGNKSATVGQELSFAVTATDVDSGVLTYDASGVPAGATFIAQTFVWTPSAAGTYPVTFIVSDGELTVTETIQITVSATPPVNTAPVLGPIGSKSVNELQQLTFTATATDADLPAQTLTFSLAPGAPANATINPTTGAFTFTPTEDQGPVVYEFTVRVSDGTISDSETFLVTVNEVNSAPVLAPIGAKSATVGVPLSFTISATDADLPANTLTYSATGVPSGATFTSSTRTFSFTPTAAGGPYNVTFTVSDGTVTDTETIAITVSAPPAALVVTPIEGANRYATAIAASKKAFPAGAATVVIATGANWPDALGGSALAGALDAPILLTRPDVLPAEVRAEIVRLGATKAIVLGGTPAVSASVFSAIDAIAGVSVERIAGANRYETANKVAARTIAEIEKTGTYSGTAFIATGANFPDALGASPLAAAFGWPIYLANPAQGANAGLVATMKAAGVTDAVLLGGTNVVSDQVRAALGATFETRLYGANRYDTAVKVAAYGVAKGLSYDKVAIATGENFPDALAGGVLQGKSGSVMLLTPSASLNAGVAAVLSANKASIFEVRFLGSTAAVSAGVRTSVTNILKK